MEWIDFIIFPFPGLCCCVSCLSTRLLIFFGDISFFWCCFHFFFIMFISSEIYTLICCALCSMYIVSVLTGFQIAIQTDLFKLKSVFFFSLQKY